ncbi:hypothetical protein F5876DRAFT_66595 [Lentinula aff. lateritia]|uniref:Uncharacterized protein n=1 Tax=Lentinula aff. lateritia TaxID=2804960 RepID=A0ACC1TXL1_9AGAR|nr:hypothetical protein F5876DRAFT_66595 [Lentinula aff. lateritia]
MKLLAVFAATVACVSAGTFVSPTNGSTISPSGTFNFTWVSSRYFKESSRSVTVLLGENLEGVVLAKNLASTAQGEGAEGPTYHAQLTPEFVASSPPGGNYQVIVIEDYSSYGWLKKSQLKKRAAFQALIDLLPATFARLNFPKNHLSLAYRNRRFDDHFNIHRRNYIPCKLLRLILNASVALYNQDKTEQEVSLQSQILNRCIDHLGSSSLHSFKQEKLRSRLNSLDLRKKKAEEATKEHLKLLEICNGEDIEKRISQVQRNVEGLETEVIPALRELLASLEPPMESERNPLNSKLDNLYINMQRIALDLGISMEGPFTQVVEGPASINLTGTDHEYGVDDTVMDGFVNWDGGLPDTSVSDSVDGESNISTFHLSFPSHVPPSTPKFSKTVGTMTDFNDPMVANTSTNPSVGSNLHQEEAATKETEPDRRLEIPNCIALLLDKRKRVKNLQEKTEYMKKLISQLQEQKQTYESLSASRRKILDRIKAQLKFAQSSDHFRQEWFNAARVITDRIVDHEITAILERLVREWQRQSSRTHSGGDQSGTKITSGSLDVAHLQIG